MELQTITSVSRDLGISPRTLRYYEQIGLIRSQRPEDSTYRAYEGETVARLRQIVLLRKLRIPLKHIAEILCDGGAAAAIQIFEQNLSEIRDEIAALATVRSAIEALLARLRLQDAKLTPLDDESILEIADSLTVQNKPTKEVRAMEEINQASEKLDHLTDRDVRIVYLPPAAVASVHCVGNRPEDRASALMAAFIRERRLPEIKPDFRHYGFNHPDGTNDDDHGYEFWVTIPEDMEVAPPFEKKHFPGGLYAAHAIAFGAFEEWGWLWQWVDKSPKYQFVPGDPEHMHGLLEELLNAPAHALSDKIGEGAQLDLLMPVRIIEQST